MANAATPEWSHVGRRVSDLESAIRFSCDGLGCALAERDEFDSSRVPGLAEALEVTPPSVIMAFPDTRQSPGIALAFLADPDGTRIELMALKG